MIPLMVEFILFNKGSKQRLKMRGDNGSPCRVPLDISILGRYMNLPLRSWVKPARD